MFDHVGFGASDYAASKAFFLDALRPLGVTLVMEGPYGAGIGPSGKPALWLYKSDDKPAPLHLAYPNYYGAFVIGPDGHNVEAVCHKPQA